MRQTLLEIAKSLANRTTLPLPNAVFGVNQAETRQIVALIEEVGEELVSRFNWQVLQFKASWAALPASSQGSVYSLADPALERIVTDTLYDESQRLPMQGPIPLPEWQGYASGLTPSPTNLYTVVNDELLLWPVPPEGNTLSFYWETSKWIVGSDGTLKASFESDEDKPLFDAQLMKLGLRAKWKYEKGLPYAEDMRAFEAMAMDKSARDMTRPSLSMAGLKSGFQPAIVVPTSSTIPVV